MKRINCIDYIRVIAVVLVVLCHCTESIYSFNMTMQSTYSLQSKLFAHCSFTLGRMGVPLFLMITGYLLLDREYDSVYTKRFYKNIVHLFICTEAWIAFAYCVWSINNSFSFTGLLKQLLFIDDFKQNHFWYMPMILECYICIPFIANGLVKMNNQCFLAFLIPMVVVLFIVPTISILLTMFGAVIRSQYGLGSFSIYWVYLLIGYYVKRHKLLTIRKSTCASIVFFCGCIIMQLCNNPNGIVYHIWYNNVFLLVSSACVFICLTQLDYKSNDSIRCLAEKSFGVYLVHNTILRGLRPLVYKLQIVLPIKVIILWSLVIIISIAVVELVSKVSIGSYIMYINDSKK